MNNGAKVTRQNMPINQQTAERIFGTKEEFKKLPKEEQKKLKDKQKDEKLNVYVNNSFMLQMQSWILVFPFLITWKFSNLKSRLSWRSTYRLC